jgi:glycosyltransferase involved in cell wall biosynthesis
MKLLFVIGDVSATGGTERVTAEIVRALSESGHQVELLSLFGPVTPYFDIPPAVAVRSAGLPQARGSLRRFAAISRRLYRECRASHPDVVVLVDTILFAFCLPWLPLARTKMVCWEHFNLSTRHGARLRELARLTASKLSHRVVVLTERDAAAWRFRFRVADRVVAIWNPIPQFGATGTPSERSDEARVVLAVGRLTHQKGFDVLLHAWHALDRARAGWSLRIVGAGEDRAKLELLAGELGIANSVVFVGQTRNVAEEYRKASVYVMSSRWEGLPMTLLEAQHFGLPSVATDCMTGPREVLSCGSGLLVPVEDSAALAHGMVRVMKDGALRERFSRLALENAQRYDVQAVRAKWDSMLCEITRAT